MIAKDLKWEAWLPAKNCSDPEHIPFNRSLKLEYGKISAVNVSAGQTCATAKLTVSMALNGCATVHYALFPLGTTQRYPHLARPSAIRALATNVTARVEESCGYALAAGSAAHDFADDKVSSKAISGSATVALPIHTMSSLARFQLCR